jgi:hypothetical protein
MRFALLAHELEGADLADALSPTGDSEPEDRDEREDYPVQDEETSASAPEPTDDDSDDWADSRSGPS